MTQRVLLDTFSAYLDLKKKETRSQYDPKLVDALIQEFSSHGFCFGFALSYAIMNCLGKLALWRAKLVAVYSWDGKPSTLKSNYELPGGKKIALEDIFEELIQAVTFYHADNAVYDFLTTDDSWSKWHYRYAHSVPSIDFKSLWQSNILGVGAAYFEVANCEGQLEHIQADARIEGQFSLEALIYVLEPKIFKDCICLVSSEKHAVSVVYNEPFWQVYDANYSHDSVVTLDKLFIGKEEVAKEVISILGNKLTIKLASLKQMPQLKEWAKSFETFKQGVYNQLLQFIFQLQVYDDVVGLTALENLACYFPDRLETFFLLAEKNERIANLVYDLVDFMLQRPNTFLSLLNVYEKTKTVWFEPFLSIAQTTNAKGLTNFLGEIKKSTSEAFLYQILLHNLEDMTLFQWSRFFDKRNFSAILAIIANAPEGHSWLGSQLLRRKPETGEVGFQIFWENSGKQHFPTFLAIIEKSNCQVAVAYLVAALKSNIKKSDQSLLEYLLSDSNFSESYLRLLLKIISKSKDQSTLFFKWLTSPNRKGWIPLQSIFDNNPDYLIPFLEEAEKNYNTANFIVPALGKPSPNGWSIWGIIEDPGCVLVAEQALEKILNLLSALADDKGKFIKANCLPYSPFWSSMSSEKSDANNNLHRFSQKWTLTTEMKI
jgi:hypothetical protein